MKNIKIAVLLYDIFGTDAADFIVRLLADNELDEFLFRILKKPSIC